MKYYFPPQNQNFRFLQTNRSDILGSIEATFNIDLQTNLGAVRVAQKLVINSDKTDDADLGRPTAFEYFDDRWWAVCGARIFKNGSELLTSSFSEDASSGAVTTYDSDESDLKIFNLRLWSTSGSTLYSKVSNGSGTGAWTSRDSLGGGIHQLSYFKKTDRLYYVDADDTISSIDTADAVNNSTGEDYYIDLDLSGSQKITCQVAASDRIWIGIRCIYNSSDGLRGSILEWDGISGQVTREYPLITAGVLAMVIHKDIPYAIDTEGRILQYVGDSFEEIARLPIDKIFLSRVVSTSSDGNAIHFNGMVVTKNNTILVLVNNQNDDANDTVTENLPSGIWELDLQTFNFTHRYSPTLKRRSSSTVTDFGQNIIVGAGAIKLNTLNSDTSVGRSSLICGFDYFTDLTTESSAIFIDSPDNPNTSTEGQKRGYLWTTFFESLEICENWLKAFSRFARLINETDKIILKYRFEKEKAVLVNITWVDTTHFTTTTDPSAYLPTVAPFSETGGVYGGEVEIIQGVGSGACVHILSATNNAGTWTVTIDNAVTGATTTTGKARLQKWIKMRDEITGIVVPYADTPIGQSNIKIQIKAVFEWTGDNEFYNMVLLTDESVNAE